MQAELSETAVQAALTTRWLGRTYVYRPELDSTNSTLKAMMAATPPPAGAVLLADYQTQGRGRLGRRWEAPPGSALLLSVLFRPDWPARQVTWLTMIGALAVAEAIEALTGLRTGLKWPNDVLVEQNGRWRKVSGLLLEGEWGGDDRLLYAILGIGINVNVPAAALPAAATPATSLLAAGGTAVSRLALLGALLARLEAWYETAVGGASPQPAWQARLLTIGQAVRVTQTGAQAAIVGVAEATDAWGQLLVRDAAGILHAIAAGDVTLRS
ncbi:MAG: biotin--[acetyl-CoA-carboxylase] ligase [Anaerolineales bacterium]|nr:biotin--[acetyl-CoA-carboxylase] ligase [Anaerolineales bacterium]